MHIHLAKACHKMMEEEAYKRLGRRENVVHALGSLIDFRELYSIEKLGAALNNKKLAKMILSDKINSIQTEEFYSIIAKIIITYSSLSIIAKDF